MEMTRNHVAHLGRVPVSLPATAMGYMMLVLRVAMGGMWLNAGLEKLFTPGGWSATGFLQHAATGPFATTFASWSGPAVDNLVIWGEILIGISLILGFGIRFAAFWGAVMALFFYLSQFPPEHGLISERLIYALLFITLMTSTVGTMLGVDAYLVNYQKKHHLLKYILC